MSIQGDTMEGINEAECLLTENEIVGNLQSTANLLSSRCILAEAAQIFDENNKTTLGFNLEAQVDNLETTTKEYEEIIETKVLLEQFTKTIDQSIILDHVLKDNVVASDSKSENEIKVLLERNQLECLVSHIKENGGFQKEARTRNHLDYQTKVAEALPQLKESFQKTEKDEENVQEFNKASKYLDQMERMRNMTQCLITEYKFSEVKNDPELWEIYLRSLEQKTLADYYRSENIAEVVEDLDAMNIGDDSMGGDAGDRTMGSAHPPYEDGSYTGEPEEPAYMSVQDVSMGIEPTNTSTRRASARDFANRTFTSEPKAVPGRNSASSSSRPNERSTRKSPSFSTGANTSLRRSARKNASFSTEANATFQSLFDGSRISRFTRNEVSGITRLPLNETDELDQSGDVSEVSNEDTVVESEVNVSGRVAKTMSRHDVSTEEEAESNVSRRVSRSLRGELSAHNVLEDGEKKTSTGSSEEEDLGDDSEEEYEEIVEEEEIEDAEEEEYEEVLEEEEIEEEEEEEVRDKSGVDEMDIDTEEGENEVYENIEEGDTSEYEEVLVEEEIEEEEESETNDELIEEEDSETNGEELELEEDRKSEEDLEFYDAKEDMSRGSDMEDLSDSEEELVETIRNTRSNQARGRGELENQRREKRNDTQGKDTRTNAREVQNQRDQTNKRVQSHRKDTRTNKVAQKPTSKRRRMVKPIERNRQEPSVSEDLNESGMTSVSQLPEENWQQDALPEGGFYQAPSGYYPNHRPFDPFTGYAMSGMAGMNGIGCMSYPFNPMVNNMMGYVGEQYYEEEGDYEEEYEEVEEEEFEELEDENGYARSEDGQGNGRGANTRRRKLMSRRTEENDRESEDSEEEIERVNNKRRKVITRVREMEESEEESVLETEDVGVGTEEYDGSNESPMENRGRHGKGAKRSTRDEKLKINRETSERQRYWSVGESTHVRGGKKLGHTARGRRVPSGSEQIGNARTTNTKSKAISRVDNAYGREESLDYEETSVLESSQTEEVDEISENTSDDETVEEDMSRVRRNLRNRSAAHQETIEEEVNQRGARRERIPGTRDVRKTSKTTSLKEKGSEMKRGGEENRKTRKEERERKTRASRGREK